MNHAHNEKKKKIKKKEGTELLNQERIRTFGEMGDYEYLGIFEAGIIQQVKMKEKLKEKLNQTS